jgi:cellulase/cellobiase CelA1
MHILFVAVVGAWAAGCTQVHQLGQVDGGPDATSSPESSEGSGESDDASSTSLDSSMDSSSETSGESTSEETDGEESGPIPDPCDIVDLGGNEGVTIDIVLMGMPWETGGCYHFYLTNGSTEDVIWARDLRFGGTLDSWWTSEAEQLNATDWRFSGTDEADNIVVLADETIVFGSCLTCLP